MPRLSLGLGVDGSGLIASPNGGSPGSFQSYTPGGIPIYLCVSSSSFSAFSGTYTLQESSVPVAGYGTGDIWYQNNSSTAIIKGWWNSAGSWNASNPPGPVFYESSSVGPQVLPTGQWGGLYGNITVASGTCAAPSGIPVASTASVVIGNAGADNNGTYVKKVPQQQLLLSDGGPLYSNIAGTCYVLGAGNADGRILFSPDAQAWNGLDQFSSSVMRTPFGSWKLGFVYFDLENYGEWVFNPIATNASTNTAYIPDTGWSPSITITAA